MLSTTTNNNLPSQENVTIQNEIWFLLRRGSQDGFGDINYGRVKAIIDLENKEIALNKEDKRKIQIMTIHFYLQKFINPLITDTSKDIVHLKEIMSMALKSWPGTNLNAGDIYQSFWRSEHGWRGPLTDIFFKGLDIVNKSVKMSEIIKGDCHSFANGLKTIKSGFSKNDIALIADWHEKNNIVKKDDFYVLLNLIDIEKKNNIMDINKTIQDYLAAIKVRDMINKKTQPNKNNNNLKI